MNWPFYVLALIAIVASFRVISNTNPVHALLSMIVSLLAVAGIFFMVGAPFAGVLEIIVYAGAILVLFVFVVMMLNLGSHTAHEEKTWLTSEVWALPIAMSFILAIVLGYLISQNAVGGYTMLTGKVVTSKAVGISLFTQYVLLVQVAALLLLGALVAAYHLAKRSIIDNEADDFNKVVQEQALEESQENTHTKNNSNHSIHNEKNKASEVKQ